MSEDALIVITSAIKTAFIDHPSSGHGTTWTKSRKATKGAERRAAAKRGVATKVIKTQVSATANCQGILTV